MPTCVVWMGTLGRWTETSTKAMHAQGSRSTRGEQAEAAVPWFAVFAVIAQGASGVLRTENQALRRCRYRRETVEAQQGIHQNTLFEMA
jgi:hypothetical protein